MPQPLPHAGKGKARSPVILEGWVSPSMVGEIFTDLLPAQEFTGRVVRQSASINKKICVRFAEQMDQNPFWFFFVNFLRFSTRSTTRAAKQLAYVRTPVSFRVLTAYDSE